MSQPAVALAVLLTSAATAAVAWSLQLRSAAVLLVLGLAYGFAFQRSRLCFASAFYGNRVLLRGILLGLALASVGSAAVVELGWNRPPRLPFGWHTLLGSFLFGFAMPFAGGCMTGTLYRLGTGQPKSLAAFLGILVGNGLGAAYAWPVTERLMNWGLRFSLPEAVGLWPATALNLAALAVLYWRLRPAHPEPVLAAAAPAPSLLRAPWPAWLGGVVVAVLFTVQFAYHSALGIQLPLARFSLWAAQAVGATTDRLSWTQFWGARLPALDPGFHLDAGLILGSLTAALLSGEFVGFRPWRLRDAAVGFAGGVVMGLAVWVAVGCNVSGFWSTVATLRVEGWLYALGLLLGARTGLWATGQLVSRGIL